MPAEAGLSVAPAEAGLSVVPAEAGLSVVPAEAGLSVVPAEAGLSVVPAEAGLSVVPAEAGLSVVPAEQDFLWCLPKQDFLWCLPKQDFLWCLPKQDLLLLHEDLSRQNFQHQTNHAAYRTLNKRTLKVTTTRPHATDDPPELTKRSRLKMSFSFRQLPRHDRSPLQSRRMLSLFQTAPETQPLPNSPAPSECCDVHTSHARTYAYPFVLPFKSRIYVFFPFLDDARIVMTVDANEVDHLSA
ncbi:hypothetical protein L596_022668 [Steinernema carpocapsae]|uniref:Uncharacterized protein n=1 Tax=Steinernema carpocapsae TaxID=34508 RepID=A0A4U5MMH1_STECR|nr:hypothetical protein L596_022668 [Steinernema carpocapsae]